jgi:hypothetical protein
LTVIRSQSVVWVIDLPFFIERIYFFIGSVSNYMGLTNRTDEEINSFNEEWKINHPNYRLTSDNCQKYAADLIVFLCGPDATKNLPWQEGTVVQTSIYSSLLAIIIGFTIYHPYWLITIFYLVVAIFVSRKEKKE